MPNLFIPPRMAQKRSVLVVADAMTDVAGRKDDLGGDNLVDGETLLLTCPVTMKANELGNRL